MNAHRAADTDAASANKALFMQYEDGELNALTQAVNDGDYKLALDASRRISALMNRINRGEIKGEAMSEWKSIKGGWDEETGLAVYHVTKGSPSLNKGDHDELDAVLKSQPAMRVALDDLVECMTIWESEGALPAEWNAPLMCAVAALEMAGK